MSSNKLNRTGHLVPTRPTGIRYKVRHGIQVVAEKKQRGAAPRQARWVKCALLPEHVQRIPEGTYFLHSDDGRIHQLRSIDGQWHYLSVAA
jgi:hypothetical protein